MIGLFRYRPARKPKPPCYDTEKIGLSYRVWELLHSAGIYDTDELCRCTIGDLRQIRWLGVQAVREIVLALSKLGLSLRQGDPGYYDHSFSKVFPHLWKRKPRKFFEVD